MCISLTDIFFHPVCGIPSLNFHLFLLLLCSPVVVVLFSLSIVSLSMTNFSMTNLLPWKHWCNADWRISCLSLQRHVLTYSSLIPFHTSYPPATFLPPSPFSLSLTLTPLPPSQTHHKLDEVLELLMDSGSVNLEASVQSSLASRHYVKAVSSAANGKELYGSIYIYIII